MSSTSIMIVGVGGQGTLLASKVMGSVMQKRGHDVKVSEVHGMSQRGGSVVTYVKFGEKVFSPVIDPGEADCILAFEELEAARYLSYLRQDGLLVMNTRRIDPMPVIIGQAKAPELIEEKLQQQPLQLVSCDALSLAEAAGSARAVNMVLLGFYAYHSGEKPDDWEQAIRVNVPEKLVDMNLAAFRSAWHQ